MAPGSGACPVHPDRTPRGSEIYQEAVDVDAQVNTLETKLIGEHRFIYTRSEASGRSLFQRVERFFDGQTIVLARVRVFEPDAAPPGERDGSSDFANSSDFQSREQSGNDGRAPWDSLTGDFKGDGFRDVVRAYHGANGRIVESIYGSAGGLNPATVSKVKTSSSYYYDEWRNLVADINADGFDDLVHVQISLRQTDIWVSFGAPAGLSAAVQWDHTIANRVRDRDAIRSYEVVAGDFDGDQRTDLAIISPYDLLFYYVLSEANPDWPNRTSTSLHRVDENNGFGTASGVAGPGRNRRASLRRRLELRNDGPWAGAECSGNSIQLIPPPRRHRHIRVLAEPFQPTVRPS